MKLLIVLSLLLNILVLVPVTYGLATSAAWTVDAYGPASPARSILLALYLAILLASVALLAWPVPALVGTLLAVQIAYKLLTPVTVGTFDNPVVTANLAIAAFHCITLWLIAARPAL